MKKTLYRFNYITKKCKNIFLLKIIEYGNSWIILRNTSITDQIFIKCKRIKNIENNKGYKKVNENISEDLTAIINYSIIYIIKNKYIIKKNTYKDVILRYYNLEIENAKKLITNKNHDYKEAWKEINETSLIDLILQKILRIKHIEKTTKNNKNIQSQYIDIINYSILLLIKKNKYHEKNYYSELENE